MPKTSDDERVLFVRLTSVEYERLMYIQRQFESRNITETVRRAIKVLYLKMQDEDENQKHVGRGKNVDRKLKDIY